MSMLLMVMINLLGDIHLQINSLFGVLIIYNKILMMSRLENLLLLLLTNFYGKEFGDYISQAVKMFI